jgi:two-component system cell cycle response regulator DivK
MKKRVLVCDDDVSISEVVALALGDSDWEVYTQPDCDDMIAKIETTRPAVIFMDNRIPREGGIHATRSIKSHPSYQQIQVVYFTSDQNIDELAQKAGADFVLRKPFLIGQLEEVVNRAFHAYNKKARTGN